MDRIIIVYFANLEKNCSTNMLTMKTDKVPDKNGKSCKVVMRQVACIVRVNTFKL